MFLIFLDDVIAGYALPSVVVEIVDNRMASSLVHEVTPDSFQEIHNHSPVSSVICSHVLVKAEKPNVFLSSLSTANDSPSNKIAQHAMT